MTGVSEAIFKYMEGATRGIASGAQLIGINQPSIVVQFQSDLDRYGFMCHLRAGTTQLLTTMSQFPTTSNPYHFQLNGVDVSLTLNAGRSEEQVRAIREQARNRLGGTS